MEGETALNDTGGHLAFGFVSDPTAIYLCSLCDKPFIKGRNFLWPKISSCHI